jgi:S-adenosylmethionine uptake transporter
MQVIGAPENSESLLGPVLLASAGVLFFCMLDAVMKAQALAMGAYSATFWRAAMGAVFASALYLPNRPQLATGRVLRLHITRGVLTAFMMLFLFWSLTQLPLAQAVGLSFVAPIIALYLAAPMLGEQITRGAKVAAVLGFGGVVVIAGEDMTAVCSVLRRSLSSPSCTHLISFCSANRPWWHDPLKLPAIKT